MLFRSESADILEPDGTEVRVPAAELGLAYRDSRLKHQAEGNDREIVLGATFRLQPASPDQQAKDMVSRMRQVGSNTVTPNNGLERTRSRSNGPMGPCRSTQCSTDILTNGAGLYT